MSNRFSPDYATFTDYILGITAEIWEGRDLAALRRHYARNVPVRMPSGASVGNEGAIAATAATLAALPDRQLLGEDVIWSVDQTGHYLSSHRILSTATHLGDGLLGPPTGRPLVYRAFADCAARDGVIDDEWLVRDNGAIARQLGHAPRDFARDLIAREGGPARASRPLTPATDIPGPYRGTGNDDAFGQRYAQTVQAMMACDVSTVRRDYDRAATLHHPGHVTGHGWDAAERFWLGLRASFPNAAFAIHHRIGRTDPLMPPGAAIRWSLTGRHDGHGAFGAPTGADVHIMAIAHAEYGPFGAAEGTIRREWVMFDEIAVWKQILLHLG